MPESIDPGTGQVTPPSGTPGNVLPVSSDEGNWSKRYAGLQTAYQKLQNEKAVLEANLQAKVANLEASLEEEKAKHVSTAQEKKTKETEATTLAAQLEAEKKNSAKLTSDLKRTKAVMGKHPALSEFEAQGLIPSAENEEDLEAILQKFETTLTSKTAANLTQKIQGAVPPLGAGGTPPGNLTNEDDLWREMADAGQKGDGRAFETAQKKWDELQKAKAAVK